MEMSGRILKMRVPGACGCGCAGENTREQLVAGGDGNDEGQKRARGVWSREAIECESERERESHVRDRERGCGCEQEER